MLVRPLHNGKVLLHWEFELSERGSNGRHFLHFPKSLGQVLYELNVHGMSMSLTNGRWMESEWGYIDHIPTKQTQHGGHIPIPRHAPQGAEVWAVLGDGERPLPTDESGNWAQIHASPKKSSSSVDERWRQLHAALAGLFCASLNQLSSSSSAEPRPLFASDLSASNMSLPGRSFRNAMLPRENVCTENLSPFVKILPCRHTRGLGALLNPLKIFQSQYHSIQIHVDPIYHEQDSSVVDGWRLRQTVSALIDPMLLYSGKASWSLSKLLFSMAEGGTAPFPGVCGCALADESSVHVHMTPAYARTFPQSMDALINGKNETNTTAPVFTLSPQSHSMYQIDGHTIVSYDLRSPFTNESSLTRTLACPRGGIDVAIQYKRPHKAFKRRSLASILSNPPPSALTPSTLSPMEQPLVVHRYLSSPTLLSGTLHLHVHNAASAPNSTMLVQLFDALPWFCRVRHSSLQLRFSSPHSKDANDDVAAANADLLHYSFIPASFNDRLPTQFHFIFRLRPQSTLSISLDFEKSFVTTDEYPPDVSRGFDIGSAIIAVRPEHEYEYETAEGSGEASTWTHAALSNFFSSPRVHRFYTTGLLLLLPFPDFSMPFNVIAFTSTLLAFLFGSMFNMTYARYEEILKRKKKWTPNKQNQQTIKEKIQNIWKRCRSIKGEEKNGQTALADMVSDSETEQKSQETAPEPVDPATKKTQ